MTITSAPHPVSTSRRLFTVAEYYRMAEVGILRDNDRTELIRGEITKMTPIGIRHAACVDELTAQLTGQLQQPARVRIQGPLHLSDYSEPQPDVLVLRPRADRYTTAHPTPADVLLLIEVSDTTYDFDRSVKLPLYAQAGIPEVWLIHLAQDRTQDTIEVYTQPVDGLYQEMRIARDKEQITAQAVPGLRLAVDSVLV
ncbi:MAG TPA: Uma2 family endonuclease [Chloroflexia bacterium]|nr:Uma2 family endonuclease [Chloroflexia bacterium]